MSLTITYSMVAALVYGLLSLEAVNILIMFFPLGSNQLPICYNYQEKAAQLACLIVVLLADWPASFIQRGVYNHLMVVVPLRNCGSMNPLCIRFVCRNSDNLRIARLLSS